MNRAGHLAALGVWVLACVQPQPHPRQARDLLASGLERVDWPPADLAGRRAGTDLRRYSAIRVEAVSLSFKSPQDRLSARLVDRASARFQALVDAELRKKGRYRLADGPGPGVLSVRPALIDLKVPRAAGSNPGWNRVIEGGEGGLQLELRDSVAGELVALTVEHGEAIDHGLGPTPTGSSAALDAPMKAWARRVRLQLDALPELAGTRSGAEP
jgi:hypothetical protein